MEYNVDVKSLSCPSCGAKLNLSNNTTGVVFCESCGTKCVISGLHVNEEILKKNNINSGLPLSGTPRKINDTLFAFLTTSDCFPIDVLQELEIISKQEIVVPAYLYTCSAFASYTYEAGNVRVQNDVVGAKGYVTTTHKKYTEWTQMSSIANDTRSIVVCGNKKYMKIIEKFYGSISPEILIDVEDLSYPNGSTTEPFNVPETSAFSQYVKPAFSGYINQSARQALQKRTVRNVSIGQPNIQKEFEARISLGIYHIVCSYNNRKFDVYFNADCSDFYVEVKHPRDLGRIQYVNNLKQQLASIKSTWLSDFFSGGFAKVKENRAFQAEEKDRLNRKVRSVMNEPLLAKQAYISHKCMFRGVLSEGNDLFSWECQNPEVPVTPNPFDYTSAPNGNVPKMQGGVASKPANSVNAVSRNVPIQNTPPKQAPKATSTSTIVVAVILSLFMLFAFISSMSLGSSRNAGSTLTNIVGLTASATSDIELTVGDVPFEGYIRADVRALNNFSETDVVFVSENNDVATISLDHSLSELLYFKITPVAAGETVVYARSADGTVSSEHIRVVVNNPIEVEAINLEEVYSVQLGESVSLNPELFPENAVDKSVIWSSSDESIVSVDSDGVITGIAGGEATITGTTANGLTDACTVVVDASRRVFNLDVSRVRDDENQIGDEWSHTSEINGEVVTSGPYSVAVGDTLTFYVRSSEDDDIPDVGENSVTHTISEEDFNNGFTVTLEVYPTEGNGPNAGLSAHYITTFTFEI